jgi:NAD(P)-dependent dehydrogenase (short-subunit alcohol dehydrogenase family)
MRHGEKQLGRTRSVSDLARRSAVRRAPCQPCPPAPRDYWALADSRTNARTRSCIWSRILRNAARRTSSLRSVKGAWFTVQKGLPLLNDGGSIILTGSVASMKGTGSFGIYAASKAAIRSFVRTWATDFKDRRIHSNVVSPGPIRTPLTSRQSADVIARIVSTVPMGRMGEPDEVARAALYLASDDSSFVTGIELFVDGGRAQV